MDVSTIKINVDKVRKNIPTTLIIPADSDCCKTPAFNPELMTLR